MCLMPNPLPLKIETALCATNRKGDERLHACLAAHACLLNRENIPRHFLKSEQDATHREWADTTNACLHSNHTETSQATIAITRSLGITQECRFATRAERVAAIITIEEIVFDGWGLGHIHYEMARFTPFTTEDISLFFDHGQDGWSTDAHYLLDCLRLRSTHKARILSEYKSLLTDHDRSSYAKAYRKKIDTEWQKFWLSSTCYKDDAENRLISTLTMLKEQL